MSLISLNYLHLTTLAIVAEHRSYTRAAEVLGITQPSVSQQMRELERACGAPVLVQHGRTLTLTPLGEQLASIGRELRAQLEQARKTVEDHASGQAGRLTIGASMTTAVTVIPEAVAKLKHDAPDVRLAVKVGNSADIAQAVVDETVDLGIVEALIHRDELVAKVFADDVLACIVSTQHPYAGKETTLQSLLGETLLIRERGSGTREAVEQALLAVPATFTQQIELNDPQAILAAVAAGVGIAWISERLAQSQPHVKIVNVTNFLPTRPFVTLHRRDVRPNPAAKAFLDAVITTYAARAD